MQLTNNPAEARTIFHYTPFLISVISLLISLGALALNIWVCY